MTGVCNSVLSKSGAPAMGKPQHVPLGDAAFDAIVMTWA